MKNFLLAWGAAALGLMVADGIWLGLLMGATYRAQIGPLMLELPMWAPALGFYLLYPAGLVLFVVQPALANGRWPALLARAAFFGLVAYGTYDLSNLATLRNWPVALSLLDMAWGGVASVLSAAAAFAALRRAPAP